MKLLSEEQKQYLLVKSKKTFRRSLKNKKKKSSKYRIVRIFSRVKIQAPKKLDLFNEENYKAFIQFITQIRDYVEKGEKVLLDFQHTESLKACAVTVLYAHIDFMQRQTENKSIIRINRSKISRVNKWFRICGLWGLTNDQVCHTEGTLEIVSAVAGKTKNHTDSKEATGKIKNILRYIKETIYAGQISEEDAMNLYAALTESISNVGLHAYSNEDEYADFIEDIGKRWWILAHKVEDQLFLMVYDMGEGIPVTLVKKDFFTFIEQIFNPQTDSDKISAAVRYGETRMDSHKHGKGLTDMKRYVLNNPKGALHIFSGMGRFSYKADTKAESKLNLPYSIGGTLIQWNVSLEGAK